MPGSVDITLGIHDCGIYANVPKSLRGHVRPIMGSVDTQYSIISNGLLVQFR